MTFQRKALGKWGETLAKQYLLKKGLKILNQNLKLFAGEVDLLAKDGKTLVLVEVKTKKELDFGGPLEMIHRRKQRKLRQLAEVFIQKNPHLDIRVDAVAIEMTKNGPQIEHIKNAVEG